uniref:Uncharacterized protein n=1 Tax=Peronospora matthiolae TaxID=2874970 RepID=A0AAV1TEQ1_9STRA
MAEIQSQVAWGKRPKVNKLEEYMAPNRVAAAYFQVNVMTWWKFNPTLYHALD